MFPGGRGGMDPKRMAAMMKQMGIDMKDIPDVEEVLIRTKTKEIVISGAEVQRVVAQGNTSWQVTGKATERARGAASGGAAGGGSVAAASPEPAPKPVDPAKQLDDDIKLVMEQANVSRPEAAAALKKANGDVAEAIVALMGDDA